MNLRSMAEAVAIQRYGKPRMVNANGRWRCYTRDYDGFGLSQEGAYAEWASAACRPMLDRWKDLAKFDERLLTAEKIQRALGLHARIDYAAKMKAEGRA